MSVNIDPFTLKVAIKRLEEMPEPSREEATAKMVAEVEGTRGWFDEETRRGVIQYLRDHPGLSRDQAVAALQAFQIRPLPV